MKSPQSFSSPLGGMDCYHLSSPSSRTFHAHQLTPSLSSAYCSSSAPPLSLPPSHYHYYDAASYADESVVSSVDDYALLSSVHSTTSDEHLSHFDHHDQQRDKPAAHDKYDSGPVDTRLLNFTPTLQPVAAPSHIEYDDAYGSESSVASSSAAPSPVFQSSSLPPLSPMLAGQLSSSSSVHTDLSTHAQSNPPSPCEDQSPAPSSLPSSVLPPQPHNDTAADYTQHPSASSIFYEPHTSPQPYPQSRHLLPPPSTPPTAPLPPNASFSLLSHAHYPVVPLTPPDSVCSAPFLPPITGSPFPFSPPVPLGQSANGGSGMAAADYVAASYSKLKAAAATMVQTRPNSHRDWIGAKIELPATKKAASKVAKARKQAASKKDRKRKRDESEDSDSDSDSSDSSSSSSSDSDSDAGDSSASSTRRRTSASSTPRRKPLSKKERNKVSASAYRKRKKAHIVALHSVADTLKTTVAQQSDMIDSITNENKALREQVSFMQKLFGTSSSFLAPPKVREAVVGEKEKVGAPPPVALPASPKLTAAVPPPTAVAPIATVNASGQVTVLSPEAEKLDLSALLLKPSQPELEVTVKKESEEAPQQAEQPTTTSTAATPSSVSSAQRASIFLFVIFTCFLLFNPNSLHAPLSDMAFSQLTASFLSHQYSGGVDVPFAAFTSTTPLPASPSPLSFLASFSSASAASLLSPEAVVRHFLNSGMGDESFFAEVLDRTYAPLVRLVGEEAAQSAIMRLAGGMLTLQLKRQHAAAAMEGGGEPMEASAKVVKVETEDELDVRVDSGLTVVAMTDVPVVSQ